MQATVVARRVAILCIALAALLILPAASACAGEHGGGEVHTSSMAARLPMWTVAPFAMLLLGIAVFPLAAPHWWEHNKNRAIVSALLAGPLAIYLVLQFGHDGMHQLQEKFHEYIAFIALLGSLFVISGGIYVQGSLSGTPLVNTAFLAFGSLIASFVGTTGASMLLIRPLLRANESRQRVTHIVVFFIFTVSNCGGLLTPLGDPPLFLGFLNGVPFEWTMRLWPQWLLVNCSLLLLFHIWDQVVLNREELERPGSQWEAVMHHQPLRIFGLHNLLFLTGVVATIYASGNGIGTRGKPWPLGAPEGIMFALAALSYFTTPRAAHEGNRFNFAPMVEVAVLFAGIFVTMIPALLILNAMGPRLGVETPAQFFWATGLLSSFLDNAPTYLTFAATAAGIENVPLTSGYLAQYLALPAATRAAEILAAISCGAVFMGANTYIGNGPNFMVKAIAEQNNIRMPGFFGYMLYSWTILLPLFGLVTLLYFV